VQISPGRAYYENDSVLAVRFNLKNAIGEDSKVYGVAQIQIVLVVFQKSLDAANI
jgi:hypothetical protein